MVKWISENPQLFGTCVTILLFIFSCIGWLSRQYMQLRIKLKDHDSEISCHGKDIESLKEDTKETIKEVLAELKLLNNNYTNIAVSVGKLEGWVEAQKEVR